MNRYLDDLYKRREGVSLGGGENKQNKQRQQGKQSARERIHQLVDNGTFRELQRFVRTSGTDYHCENVVTGYGKVFGRTVCVYAQDFTIQGGSLGEMHSLKITKLMDYAYNLGVPIVGLCDSAGAKIQEGVKALEGYGELFYRNAKYSGKIPQISVIMGPCAGGAVYSPALTDFVFMVKQTSHMFLTGSKVVKAVTGKNMSHEELGGSQLHATKSGDVHFVSENETDCLRQVRKLLSYLPQNNKGPNPIASNWVMEQKQNQIESVVPDDPKKIYNMIHVIAALFDTGSYMEVQTNFAANITVGFAKLDGNTVGVVANNPKYKAGALDVDASDKAARFIRFCDCFAIPIVTLEDVSGFIPGVLQQESGIIRHGAKLLYAYAESCVPKVTVILRKAYGGAYVAMNSKSIGADLVFAWPTAEIAVMGAEGAVDVLYSKEIQQDEHPESKREQFIEQYKREVMHPYIAAELGVVDDVISPSETRSVLIESLDMLRSKTRNDECHGNIPL
ncbi:methylmalonyl-CoA carboxyltransferase [Bacillaceae bacterium JMAK1]|nr:methylmalonyl-CoA carboxyltransferase [Bacillaceae bacterium JMAK1]